MMGRKFFISDLHGEYIGLIKLLDHVCYDPKTDQLVFGGDLINRGRHSGQLLQEVKRLQQTYPKNVFVLLGNHEEMMINYMCGTSKLWLAHGGYETILSLNEVFRDEAGMQDCLTWVRGLPIVFEDDKFVYTHAGLDPAFGIFEQKRDIIWIMNFFDYNLHPREQLMRVTNGKPIIHGHNPITLEDLIWDGVTMNCDLGSHTADLLVDRNLGLFDLMNNNVYVYRTSSRLIELHELIKI
ncbi:serine/threonine protein phosphatase [Paenibacillus psychroresistens]|uniref:Serine/threonine protein phosphatase n=1 Tax=Paenibacillus psychroresistens TaxID=1778678 RepID=A0A6B8RQG6_9BACL|nr:metallophosphoesterase [Paenibacillus psychroresistens]QGQ97942.1 serine/threonine protein phosphatase [Paenibacillus psychroresistens]